MTVGKLGLECRFINSLIFLVVFVFLINKVSEWLTDCLVKRLSTKMLSQLQWCPARFKLYTVGNYNILISYGGKLPNAEKCKFMSTRAGAAYSNATEDASISCQSTV
jgi:hypothetical protein